MVPGDARAMCRLGGCKYLLRCRDVLRGSSEVGRRGLEACATILDQAKYVQWREASVEETMKRIFITGMSGTGKSSVCEELRSRGFAAIDTDDDGWCELSTVDGEPEWILREDRLSELLAMPLDAPLFVSGCRSNQGKFTHRFDHTILFSAPLEVMLERVARRTSNPYGKSDEQRAEICWNFEHIQPLLKKSADLGIDSAAMSVSEVTDFLIELALRTDAAR